MKEKFENRRLSGNIQLTLSSERKLPGIETNQNIGLLTNQLWQNRSFRSLRDMLAKATH